MKDMGIVKGSKEQAVEVIVGIDTVYEHTDIELVETEDGSELYQYHEIQYTLKEWIGVLGQKNQALQEEVNTTTETLDDLMTNVIPALLPVDDSEE